ncbi:MAG TPA: cysteine desulfurase family protein [Chthoniobacteraceae bacterium]|nr:cysteine desulfurase family protein [Chthoniobacteraceae bacterium]
MIYLDYNATTPLAPEVFAAMRPVLEHQYGNPSSIHAVGRDARAVIDDARDRLATLLGARPHEIIFTGGGTEADNLALLGLARQRVRDGAERHIVTPRSEHHAILHAAEFLEAREGFRVSWLEVDAGGRVDPEAVRAAITGATALVSVMSANNETGTLQPIAEIAAVCREKKVLFHSDMIQSFGKLPVRVDGDEPGPDAISLAAHKFYGPKGVGALWLRAGIPIDRTAYGGSHENARRPGTENVAGIAGLVAAAERASAALAHEQPRQARLRDRLWEGIARVAPMAIRNGDPLHTLANTLNVSFPGLDGESLLMNLDLEGVAVSSGSACMVGSIQPSHVLLAMGVPAGVAQATVRFSLGEGTDAAAIEKVVAALARIVDRLRVE